MKQNPYIRFIIVCLTALSLNSTSVPAQDTKTAPKSKSEAAKKAQQKVSGRVLKVDQNKSKYRVKVLQKSGRVVSVDVDKKSGKVSQKKKKD
ncbi:PepSY domain-containing protein [Paraglaciecola psychrophila]|uniref:Propeptide, pepSY amd peptidase M4 n=1 Tax=Paraglaciecola psychrophila 170 TaxID=1129794 RepID=K6ZZY6_9ALTE|nr:PepSY domain-containing protein [Paraglaciecola psychrophila]AGH46100.1 propeptide, pepSY amd peptidase M4 [Paraglaciecola psychrophila 170]GAC35757.1 peptidase [Paraglaciecola psychrophila 170]